MLLLHHLTSNTTQSSTLNNSSILTTIPHSFHIPNYEVKPFVILQLSCNGVKDKIRCLLSSRGQSCHPKLISVLITIVRKDRGTRQGKVENLLVIIHKSVQCREIPLSPPTDKNTTRTIAIASSGLSEILLINVYLYYQDVVGPPL